MTAESLLRVLFAVIERDIGEKKMGLSVGAGKRENCVGEDFGVNELADHLTFCEAILLVKKYELISEEAAEICFVVKDKRC